MATFLDNDELYILRRARKDYPCRGDGARPAKRVAACYGIKAGQEYVEYVGDVPLYQTGDRICRLCARELHGEELKKKSVLWI